MKLLIYALAVVLLVGVVHANLAVESFAVNPMEVAPGGEVSIELTLENAGDDDIEKVLVSLDLTEVPFAPAGSSTQAAIDEIDDHRREKVTFTLKALPQAAPNTYKIPVQVSSAGVSSTSFISIEVAASPQLDILVGDTDVLQVGGQGTVVLKFVNNGLGDIHFLTVTLPGSSLYRVISPSSVYIGEVDTADFETEEFTIVPLAPHPILEVQLQYRDTANKRYAEAELLRLPAYMPEEFAQLGLGEPPGKIVPVIAVLAVLVIAFLLYRKLRKRRRHET